ncbi:MAG: TonB-dependent receptor [Bacteroidota bacterium]
MNLLSRILSIVMLVFWGGISFAQTEKTGEFAEEEVVITAQHGASSVQQSVHQIRVISREKIDQLAAVNLGDALRNELNLRISQDNVLGASVSMQGVSGQNVNIMIDGVPVIGRQGGNLDLSQINLQDVERIEIVEGPLSVNYGTNALAGTINLITRQQVATGTQLQASAYQENIGHYNQNARLAWRKGKHQLQLSGGRNFFDGWSETDAFLPDFSQPLADSSRFDSWKPREQYFARLQYHRQIKRLRLGIKSELFDERITNRGFPRSQYVQEAVDDQYDTRRLDQSVFLNGDLGRKTKLQAVAAFNHYLRYKNSFRTDLTTLEQTPSTTEGAQDTSLFTTWMSRASLSHQFDSTRLVVELGYDVRYETARGRRIENIEQDLGDYAVFATAQWQPVNWLKIRPGLRYAYNTDFASPLVPSISLRVGSNQLSVRASYARGFRAPVLKELYFFFVDINHNIRGNQNLQAEFSDNYTASVAWQKVSGRSLMKAELTGFYNDIDNLITLGLVNADEQLFSYVNVGVFQSLGSKLNVSWQNERLKAQVGVSWIGRYNQLSAENTSVERFSYSPEATGSLNYRFPRADFSVNLFYKYQGRLPNIAFDRNDNIVENFIDAYSLLDLSLLKSFWQKKLTLSLGSKNLLDVRRVAASSSTGVHSAGINSVSVGNGRTLFVKLDLNLQ